MTKHIIKLKEIKNFKNRYNNKPHNNKYKIIKISGNPNKKYTFLFT